MGLGSLWRVLGAYRDGPYPTCRHYSIYKEDFVSKSASPVALGDTQDHLLALPEVARRLACSPGLVRRLGARGTLPRVKLGRLVRYRASDVARLVNGDVSGAASPAA